MFSVGDGRIEGDKDLALFQGGSLVVSFYWLQHSTSCFGTSKAENENILPSPGINPSFPFCTDSKLLVRNHLGNPSGWVIQDELYGEDSGFESDPPSAPAEVLNFVHFPRSAPRIMEKHCATCVAGSYVNKTRPKSIAGSHFDMSDKCSPQNVRVRPHLSAVHLIFWESQFV